MLTAIGFEVESRGRVLLKIGSIRRALVEVERNEERSLGNSRLGHNGSHCWLLSHLRIGRNHLGIEVARRLRLLDLDHVNDGSLLVHFDDSSRVSVDLDDRLSGRIFDFETTSSLLDCHSLTSDNAQKRLSLLRRDLHIRALVALSSVTIE